MLVALTLLCAVQPVAGPLPANCSMVANDTAVAGGFCETIERETIEPCSKPLWPGKGQCRVSVPDGSVLADV